MGVTCSKESTAVDLRTPLLRETAVSPVQTPTYPPLFSTIAPSTQNENSDTPTSLRQPLLQSHHEAEAERNLIMSIEHIERNITKIQERLEAHRLSVLTYPEQQGLSR